MDDESGSISIVHMQLEWSVTLENTQTPPEGSTLDGPSPPNPARGGGPL
ncbi:MAG: hypothetical protein LIP01_05640 [Tannerellaceae bacterium]|nr:hypothetical protein [Tannerellaceae bacterium]